MGIIFEILIKVFVKYTINYPVSFLRWILGNKRRSFNDYLDEYALNWIYGFFIFTIILLFVHLVL